MLFDANFAFKPQNQIVGKMDKRYTRGGDVCVKNLRNFGLHGIAIPDYTMEDVRI